MNLGWEGSDGGTGVGGGEVTEWAVFFNNCPCQIWQGWGRGLGGGGLYKFSYLILICDCTNFSYFSPDLPVHNFFFTAG